MAVLSTQELAQIRNACAATQTVNYTKTQINLACQAIEDFMVGQAAAISSVIDTATSPLVFTNAQKKKLFAEWCERKFQRDK